jgi:hypothetical protein
VTVDVSLSVTSAPSNRLRVEILAKPIKKKKKSSKRIERSDKGYDKVCQKVEPTTQETPCGGVDMQFPEEISVELAYVKSFGLFRRSSRKRSRFRKSYGKFCQKIEHATEEVPQKVEQDTEDVPDEQSDRRGPPTDRPPDKPPPWKGAVVGSLFERAGSRHASQLASSRGSNGLSGNASPMQKICNLRAKMPSNLSHCSTAAGSSLESVRSWMHTGHRRPRAKRDTCVTFGHPSPNLGRNLFPLRRFSCGVPNQRVQWHSVTTVTSIGDWLR